MQPTTTVAEVKQGIEAAAGPKWMEQVLLLSADDGSRLPLTNEDTLGTCGVSSVSILVVEPIHTAKVTGADGGNRGFSHRTEVMMRRRKVMDAVMQGWASAVTHNTPHIVKARLDPDRTPEAAFLTFVQEQLVLIRHVRVQRGLTADQILERAIAQHMEEDESEEAVPPQPAPPAVMAAEPEPEPEAEPTLVAQTPGGGGQLDIFESDLLGATRQLNTSKLIVTGDGRVGKTSLLKRLRGEAFDPAEVSTVGVVACTVDVREEAWGDSAGKDGRYETMLAAEHLQQEQQAKRQAEEQAWQQEIELARQRDPDWLEPELEPEWEPGAPERKWALLARLQQPTQLASVPAKQPLRINSDSERTVQTGEGVSIFLSVESNRSSTAQWLKDGEAIVDSDDIRGTTTQMLVFDSVQASDAGVYCCRVSNGDEVITSAGQTLELVPSEPIRLAEISPAQTWVSAGGKMDFGVRVTAGGFPGEKIVLNWYHSGKLLDITHTKISRDYFIVINDASTADAGDYYVDVQYKSQQDACAEPVRSETTTVHVTGSDIQGEVARIIREKGEAALTDDTPTKVVHDFAGQRMYYILHAILLTRSLTRYVVAVSLEHDLTDLLEDPEHQVSGMTHGENLGFWLNSIHSGAPEAPILLICTKADLVSGTVSESEKEARVVAVRASLKGKPYAHQIHPEVMRVSSMTGEGVEEVRKVLDDTTGVADYGDVVGLKWFKWYKIAQEMVAKAKAGLQDGRRRISYEEAKYMAIACDIEVNLDA